MRSIRLRRRPILAAIAAVTGAVMLAVAVAPAADALPPDPIDPPELDVEVPFEQPSGGFFWRVDSRFGSRVIDPGEPDTPALVNYHYCAPERPAVNCERVDANGNPTDVDDNKYTYDPAHVHPTALTARFDGCPTESESNSSDNTDNRYRWQVINRVTGAVLHDSGPVATCNWSYDFPINPDTGRADPNTGVRLTITTQADTATPILGSPFEQDVVVRDYLIVSIGDSYGSGEGVPDVPQKFADGGAFDLPWVQRGARWIDKRCHRSAGAAAAQASLRLESADPHSSVTFLSFACSGANISAHTFEGENPFNPYSGRDGRDAGAGILSTYFGAEPSWLETLQPLPPQLEQLENATGTRTIDALLVSAGGNDMGFSRIGAVCVIVQNCPDHEVSKHTLTDPNAPGANDKIKLRDRVTNDLAELPARYDDLADEINLMQSQDRIDVSRLYLNEYPDLLANDTRGPCYGVLDDVLPLGTVIAYSLLIPLLSLVWPPLGYLTWVEIGAMILSGAVPPFGMLGHETEWARETLLPVPPGPTVPPTHGLDRIVYDAVQRHSNDTVPWTLVDGIHADFHGWGDNSGGVGHGYCADQSWVRNATDATDLQGKYTLPGLHGQNSGMLHPNSLGQEAISRRIYDQIESLLDEPPAGMPQAPIFFTGDTNTSGNTVDNAHGNAYASSREGDNGWLVGCVPNGSQCESPSHRSFAQIVARVAPGTFVKGARLMVDGMVVVCGNAATLPPGVTCQSETMDQGRLQKWSFQFAHDGKYQLDATVNARDGGVQSFTREIKVDLHDPGDATVAFSSAIPQTGRFFRAPAVATFDLQSPDATVTGVRVRVDGAPSVVKAKSQLGSLPVEFAQATISTDGHHTLSFEAIDAAGRTGPTQTFPVDINLTPPSGPIAGWGANTDATLGDGTRTNRLTPVLASDLADATTVATRSDFAIAQRADGTLVGWGRNYGQFVSATNPVKTPIAVGGFAPGAGPIEIAAGGRHVLALMPDGRVLAWGADDYGQLGDGSAGGSRSTPQVVSGLGAGSGVVHIAAGDNHSLAVTATGQVYAWGTNRQGQLADATLTDRANPVAVTVPAGSRVIDIAGGSMHSVALRQDGTGLAWGYNGSGMTVPGNSTQVLTQPTIVPGLTDAVEIASGERFNMARRADGTVVAWGVNDSGQLVNGASYAPPTPIPYVVNATSIAAGARFGMARRSDGVVMAWGENAYGQIGTGSTSPRVAPTAVNLGSGRVAQHVIAAGATFALVLSNEQPTASLQTPATATVGQPVTLTAVASDTDGSVTAYAWDFGDFTSTTGSTATTTHVYNQTGTFEVAVTVVDDDGALRRATGTVTVTEPAPNVAPTAQFTAPAKIVSGQSMYFDASASTDDGVITDYAWNFGDGETASGVSAEHTFANTQDAFTVTLTVTDDEGATATTQKVLPVEVQTGNPLTISVQDATVTEGNTAAGADGEIRIVANRPVPTDVTVTIDHELGTATFKKDYVLNQKYPRTVKIPAGATEVVLDWHTKGDRIGETAETFGVHIATATSGVSVADADATLTIADDDGGVVHLRVEDATVAEGNPGAPGNAGGIRIVADRPVPSVVSISVASNGGDAQFNLDYTMSKRLPRTVKIEAGATEVVLPWTTKPDTVVEPDETFVVGISTSSGGVVIDDEEATMTISNDD